MNGERYDDDDTLRSEKSHFRSTSHISSMNSNNGRFSVEENNKFRNKTTYVCSCQFRFDPILLRDSIIAGQDDIH